jgi:Asp/Glu/hydantoin racemase
MTAQRLRPRIGLIHAIEESVIPARAAFAQHWPEAQTFDLLDSSLASDLADVGSLGDTMLRRFLTLASYAAGADGTEWKADGLLFTGSAFGPAVDAVKAVLTIPVLKPNEAAFRSAVETSARIGLVVTFEPSLTALRAEMQDMARTLGRHVDIEAQFADGALRAFRAGDVGEHDQIIGAAASKLASPDIIVLGQFSSARAAPLVASTASCPVLTTPRCAVEALRNAVAMPGAPPGPG